MAWHEREYYGQQPGQGSAGGVAQMGGIGLIYPRWGSITLYLIIINCAIFFLDGLIGRMTGAPWLYVWGLFSAELAFLQGQVWRLITFQFLHAGGWHLFGNMLILFFLGTIVENYFGPRRFIAFYLIAGIGGVLGYLFFWASGLLATTAEARMVGASAGVFGVIVAATVVAPNMRVLLFFLIPVPLKVLLYVLLFVAAYVVLARGAEAGVNAGGEAAHLGGAAIGFLLIRMPHVLDWADRGSLGEWKQRVEQKRQLKVQQRQQAEDAEVDRILDKVRTDGLGSLSAREKKVLNRATERQRRENR